MTYPPSSEANTVEHYDPKYTVIIRVVGGVAYVFWAPPGTEVIVVDLDNHPNAWIDAGANTIAWGKDPD